MLRFRSSAEWKVLPSLGSACASALNELREHRCAIFSGRFYTAMGAAGAQ